MKTHPKTGLHYIVSFRQAPPYDDAMRMYERMAVKYEWLECIKEPELIDRMDTIAADERNFVVVWGAWSPRPPGGRKAMFTRVYGEALDEDLSNMLPHHRNWLGSAQANIRHMDGVFGHTPWMAGQLSDDRFETPGFVLPVGWDRHTFGEPDWSAKKMHRFTYVGAVAGKRSWVVPGMKRILGDDFHHAHDVWGPGLCQVLNASAANLYLSHTDIHSFSTYRIWQTLSSSAALIAESGRDCWPLADDMYIKMKSITQPNGPSVTRVIQAIPNTVYLKSSKRLHDGLAEDFCIEKVIENYLIPASQAIKDLSN